MEPKYEKLAEKFRAFKNNLSQKYGIDYLAKMSPKEQQKYIKMNSTLSQSSPEKAKQNILRAIDYANKVTASLQQGSFNLMDAQAEVTKIHASIQGMIDANLELSEQEIENIREQLNDILALPSDNLSHLSTKIGYLNALKDSLSELSMEEEEKRGLIP